MHKVKKKTHSAKAKKSKLSPEKRAKLKAKHKRVKSKALKAKYDWIGGHYCRIEGNKAYIVKVPAEKPPKKRGRKRHSMKPKTQQVPLKKAA